MSSVDITCEDIEPPSWVAQLEGFVYAVLEHLEYHNWELSIVLTDNAVIQRLNREYRGKDEPTDVLSFGQQEGDAAPPGAGPWAAGDIVVSLAAVAENAEEFGESFEHELKRVLVHGILHLAGHTHPDSSPEQPMLQLQETVLRALAEEHRL